MKANELKKLIGEVVKKEIKQQVIQEVNKALSHIIAELIKSKSAPASTKSKPAPALPHREISEDARKILDDADHLLNESVSNPPTPKIKISTGNPMLDAALAETAKTYTPNSQPTGEFNNNLSNLISSGFDKIGNEEEAITTKSNRNVPKTNIGRLREIVSEASCNPSVTETAVVPDALKKIFNRDFRSLMKAIDQKKNAGPTGIIDPSKVISG